MQGTYIIAEAGVNHNGSLELAKKLIDVAKASGANAVKFQTFKAENIVSKKAPKAAYQLETTDAQESQFDMIQKLELDVKAHLDLKAYTDKVGIDFLSTPFDLESVDLLVDKVKVQRLKVPSGEITNAPLVLKMALSGLPILISTGMATLPEIETALGVLAFGYLKIKDTPSPANFARAFASAEGQGLLKQKVGIFQCTTNYPAAPEEINLLAMDTIKNKFGLPVGLSDHSIGIEASVAAVARGATVIEKHFTLDTNMPGPDHRASLNPEELKQMVATIRLVEKFLGSPVKGPSANEAKNIPIVRKSLVAHTRIKKGEPFAASNLAFKRPGTGISPLYYWETLGKLAKRDFEPDDLIEL